jgi:hypothetical protein
MRFSVRHERVQWARPATVGEESEAKDAGGIQEGEEILSHYCDVTLPVQERREWAAGALGGMCRCIRCLVESGESDD